MPCSEDLAADEYEKTSIGIVSSTCTVQSNYAENQHLQFVSLRSRSRLKKRVPKPIPLDHPIRLFAFVDVVCPERQVDKRHINGKVAAAAISAAFAVPVTRPKGFSRQQPLGDRN